MPIETRVYTKCDCCILIHYQARENAKMKVLLMKYIDKDDSLLCTSQLSMADASQQEVSKTYDIYVWLVT